MEVKSTDIGVKSTVLGFSQVQVLIFLRIVRETLGQCRDLPEPQLLPLENGGAV